MDKHIKGPMKRYLATITETIVNSKTLVLEARSPEDLRRQIEDEGNYNPEQLDPQTVEVDVEIVKDLPDAEPSTKQVEDLDQILTGIASKQLGIPTLNRRWSDKLDFHDVSAWSVKDALKAAFEAGRKTVEELNDSKTESPDAEPETCTKYTYRPGRNGVDDTWDIIDPDGNFVDCVRFWDSDDPSNHEAEVTEARAKLIVDILNRGYWW